MKPVRSHSHSSGSYPVHRAEIGRNARKYTSCCDFGGVKSHSPPIVYRNKNGVVPFESKARSQKRCSTL